MPTVDTLHLKIYCGIWVDVKSKQDSLYYLQTENAAIGEIRFLGQEAFI